MSYTNSSFLLKPLQVCERLLISKTTLYSYLKNPKLGFPRPLKLTKKTVLFDSREIDDWIKAQRVDSAAPAARQREEAGRINTDLGNTKGYCSPLSKNNVKNGGGDA